ncbi:hypothetical protein Thal_1146 [Thermocrinis albus DSM 14484]|uniref:Uncharacterized protein n=1 Tax=Thermocrinis albus (strain DSM 14484 / JCM 11386 / HI 11/12) TaxID=638303 RepID=D3SLZ8_THEAH|nr:hypothetical protein [Thermocrinis albus]ADC89778.1 hypothetical protein Thal_1146 [Thermocrinis albus DSM 14484]
MMKRVFVLISLAVAILVTVGNVFAQDKTSNIPEPSLGPEWKLIFTDSDGSTFYVNTRKINYLPEGIVKVWTLNVLRGEWRERFVNSLKKDLTSEGKDPNNAERLWYSTFFIQN